MSSKYKNDIIRLRKQEKTYDEIKQKLGCSKSTISYHCKQEGLEDIGKKKKEVNEKTKKKIKSLRKEKTINQVSKELGVGKSTVVKYSDPSDNQKTEVRSSLEKEKYLESKKYRGELAEEKIAVRFMEKGYTVLDPRGREKYDIVIQKNDKFIKIQCKHGNYKGSHIEINTTWIDRDNKNHIYSEEDVDYFATWCKETNEVYVIPVEEVGTRFSIRLKETKNGQTTGVNWHEDYIL